MVAGHTFWGSNKANGTIVNNIRLNRKWKILDGPRQIAVAKWLAHRLLNLQFTGSNTGGATRRVIALSKLVTHNYSGQLSLSYSRGRSISTSFGWGLKVLRTTAGRLDAPWNVCSLRANLVSSHSTDVAAWRSYSAKRHTCTYVTQCKASSGH